MHIIGVGYLSHSLLPVLYIYIYICTYTNMYKQIYVYPHIYNFQVIGIWCLLQSLLPVIIYIHSHTHKFIYQHMYTHIYTTCRLLELSVYHSRCCPSSYTYIHIYTNLFTNICIHTYIQLAGDWS